MTGFQIDAQTALDYLTSNEILRQTPIVCLRICAFFATFSLRHTDPLWSIDWRGSGYRPRKSKSNKSIVFNFSEFKPISYLYSFKVAALILENTFTSLPELVPHALPVLGPFSFLCHQKWNSASKIPLIPATTPILMLSGARDEIIPKAHMRALWETVARRGERKTSSGSEYKVGLERAKFMEFENGGHSAFFVFLDPWRF